VLMTVIMIAAELYARSRPTGTAAPAAPGELDAAAAVSGFLAGSFPIRLLRTRTLWPFIWYRGLFVLLLTTVRS
jgi:undecaprenyl pyrophosphate phosphatase UppP